MILAQYLLYRFTEQRLGADLQYARDAECSQRIGNLKRRLPGIPEVFDHRFEQGRSMAGNGLDMATFPSVNIHMMNSQSETHTLGVGERRNPAEYLVLGFLAAPAHGYDVYQRIRNEVGILWHIGRSQLYALLARLERDGLLVHQRVGQENLPAKNIFSLTELGRNVFEKWRDSPVSNVRELRLEFLAKLFLAHQAGLQCEQHLLKSQIGVCREKVGRLRELRESSRNQIERSAVEFRLVMAESSLTWLTDTLRASLDGIQ